MNPDRLKFLESRQEAVKLELALAGYFREGAPEADARLYGDYLSRRRKAAARVLIEREDTKGLYRLERDFPFGAELLDDLLAFAAKQRAPAAFFRLLDLKAERFGFPPEEFLL